MTTKEMLRRAKQASFSAPLLSHDKKVEAVGKMCRRLELARHDVLEANARDVERAREKLGAQMIDRLTLDDRRLDSMIAGMEQVSKLPDPAGRIIGERRRPDGLLIRKVTVPLGVVAVIYESRPNVTSDAATLAFMSSNVAVLRCGSDCYETSSVIVRALREGLSDASVCEDMINLVPDPSRKSAEELMTANGLVDVLIPRGGKGLIQSCLRNATVPGIETGTGICHIYVEKTADQDMALDIIHNAKTSRPSVCNAAEVCLVDRAIAAEFLPKLRSRLNNVELRLDPEAAGIIDGRPAGPDDFDTEFLDLIMAVGVVSDVYEATEHIALHSTHHSEAIITRDPAAADVFRQRVDSAAVYVNASTRFTDGGEFGLGCEMGISTQKLHARGPMGLSELVSYKYLIEGNGHVR